MAEAPEQAKRQEPRRFLPWLILGVATVGSAGALAIWHLPHWSAKSQRAFPSDEEVQEVRAALTGTENFTPRVAEFTVPPEYVPRLLAAFRPVERKEYPASWDAGDIARLEILTKEGLVRRITVPFSGKNPLCFRLDGIQCFRGGKYLPVAINRKWDDQLWISECGRLVSAIHEIWRQQTTGARSDRLEDYLQDLERSAGARPRR